MALRLRDYLHKGGVQGRVFYSEGINDNLKGVYMVQFVYIHQDSKEVALIVHPLEGAIRKDVYLKYHFEDAEVARAKESQLAQKIKSSELLPPKIFG